MGIPLLPAVKHIFKLNVLTLRVFDHHGCHCIPHDPVWTGCWFGGL